MQRTLFAEFAVSPSDVPIAFDTHDDAPVVEQPVTFVGSHGAQSWRLNMSTTFPKDPGSSSDIVKHCSMPARKSWQQRGGTDGT